MEILEPSTETVGQPICEKQYLPLSAVAEVIFCPRNFYYRCVEGAEEANHHVLEGRYQEEQRNERKTRRYDDRVQTRQVFITSEVLGIRGVLDVLEEQGGGAYPVEFKKGIMADNLNDEVQVCLQAMLLEEAIGKEVSQGYIYYVASAERKMIIFNEALRQAAYQAIETARTIWESPTIPHASYLPRCNGCALRERCMPEESAFITQGEIAPRKPTPSQNLGRTLYIDVPGAALRKRESRLVVEKEGQPPKDITISAIDQVVISHASSLTSAALTALTDLGVPLYLLEKGNVIGWVQPTWNKNVPLRRAQYRFCDSLESTLEVAKQMIYGKVSNQRTFLMRGNRERKIEEVMKASTKLEKMLAQIMKAPNKEILLGFEGLAGRIYFEAYGFLLKKEVGFDFERRNRRPPKDPINALLSFAYSLLMKDCLNGLSRAGLDPFVGVFHSEKYGRPALALDLMEEFRTIIGDSVVLNVINRNMIKEADFEPVFGGIQLKNAFRKKFFEAYQNRIKEEATHPVFGYRVNYLRLIEIQARYLAKVMQKEWPNYQAYRVR